MSAQTGLHDNIYLQNSRNVKEKLLAFVPCDWKWKRQLTDGHGWSLMTFSRRVIRAQLSGGFSRLSHHVDHFDAKQDDRGRHH